MADWHFQRGGILCVVSGPSGSGKTTLCRRFSETDPEAVYAVSATTRAPREGERDGVDYHFLDRTEFEVGIERGDFLEYAEVHGRLYGTLKSEVLGHLAAGRDVLMDLDVQGAASVRSTDDEAIRTALVDIFIQLPGDDELVKRL
ncbi:MAG TPA: guanylate kinase, partial [Bacteroidia bacterium]|nr:guanylate kinase [Bacteroidia bacterium]